MEGVPAKDAAEWRFKKENENGIARDNLKNQLAKRPKVFHGVISESDLAVQLAQHKALMNGGLQKQPEQDQSQNQLGGPQQGVLGFPPAPPGQFQGVPPPPGGFPPYAG